MSAAEYEAEYEPALAEVLEIAREHAERVDREAVFPAESMAALRTSGLLGMFVPCRYGGLGDDLHSYARIAGRLAAACMSTAAIWTMHAFQVEGLSRFAGDRLRQTVLPAIAEGKIYLASVTTEARKGADLFTAEAALARRDGLACFERDAPVVTGGRHADAFLITLRSTPEAQPHEVSLVYAEREQLRISEHGAWDPMGMRGTESVGLTISGSVPLDQVVGRPGRFEDIARDSMIPLAHVGWSACWLGAAHGAFSDLLRWLRSPERRGGPDVHSELVRERLARIRVDLDLVSAYLTRLCDELTAARSAGRSWSDARTRLRVNTLKLAASELTFQAADSMVQLAGMNGGYSRLAPLKFERHFRDLRSARLNHSNDRMWPATGALTLLDPKVTLL
ncbi:acyl-CoA dehydrogenase [Kitasatospora sp. MAP12-15]|uniref:acyl-CoA dehydrogenase family protein n=1 Tax=unclassified Kitasatospora TaxID=2633591 RepID=UPI0024771348|nr:acyl-CoA dehydrogenase family protein [Kitasatospora sp. MAP12-44]MDH6108216.1 acyl-CoA dehydrogenase [Kitasatospora sp. MAP12-44]